MLTRIVSFFSALIMALTSFLPLCKAPKNIQPENESLILPETWAAVDSLGRTLPAQEQTGEKDNTKFVGMFYWIWHTNFGRSLTPKNATEILTEHPEILHDFDSPVWESESFYPDGRPFFWNKPIWGYYSDLDEYVIRKNAELIADAGVDVIIFDCTNDTATWDDAYEKLFEIFETAKADGVNVPKVAFMLPFADSDDTVTSLKNLYSRIYSKNRYSDLWFMWDGKPLIMAHSACLSRTDSTEKEILNFFTFRKNDPSYFSNNTSYRKKTWGWCSEYPQAKYGKRLGGNPEQMCVSVAQNACDGRLAAMNNGGNVQGRSFAKGDYSYTYEYAGKKITASSDMENALLYGINFQQQWDYAIEQDPDFIFVTGWNEWIAGRWKEWEGTKNAFPDQFSDEYSRDIEPSDGILKDNYYYQLVANIRRFKGISAKTIENEAGVKTYYHYTNSTRRRDCDGWVGEHYTADTLRNDFTRCDVSSDGRFIYMTIETKENITPYTDSAWMRVLLDTDQSGKAPNWEGFEYIINRGTASAGTVDIEKSLGGWSFEKTGEAAYTVNGSKMMLKIPAYALGLGEDIHFNFKLSDNMQADGDIMDFYKSGDVAPGGRFTFVY